MRIFFILFSTLFLTMGFSKEPAKRVPLIVDSDANLDDMMCLFYLLKSERVDLLGVTTTSNGISHYKYGARNILNFLELAEHPDIPVSESKKYPIAPNGAYPKEWREMADAVNNIKLPYNIAYPEDLDSVDFLIQKISSHREKVTLLCTGPLTNLALALIKEPSIKKNIERVFIVGGAINVRGNLVEKHNGYVNRFAEIQFLFRRESS